MREEITRLMSLQAIDRELRELQGALATVSERSVQLRQEALDYAAELERLQQEDAAERDCPPQSRKGTGGKRGAPAQQAHAQQSGAQRPRALAVDHEIESLKETKQRLESELLAMMEAAEQRTARIKVLIELRTTAR